MAEGKAALDFVAVQCFQCNVRCGIAPRRALAHGR
jgi:hypothetical protein